MKTKHIQKTQNNLGGFHAIWLIPLEGLLAFTLLTIALKFRLGVVLMLFLFLSLTALGYLINIIANNLPKVTHYFEPRSKVIKQ